MCAVWGPHIAYDNKCPAYTEARAAVAVSVQTGKSYRDALLSVREDATVHCYAKGVPSLPALPLAEAPGAERQSAETNTDRLPSLDNTLHTLAAEKCGTQPVTTEARQTEINKEGKNEKREEAKIPTITVYSAAKMFVQMLNILAKSNTVPSEILNQCLQVASNEMGCTPDYLGTVVKCIKADQALAASESISCEYGAYNPTMEC